MPYTSKSPQGQAPAEEKACRGHSGLAVSTPLIVRNAGVSPTDTPVVRVSSEGPRQVRQALAAFLAAQEGQTWTRSHTESVLLYAAQFDDLLIKLMVAAGVDVKGKAAAQG